MNLRIAETVTAVCLLLVTLFSTASLAAATITIEETGATTSSDGTIINDNYATSNSPDNDGRRYSEKMRIDNGADSAGVYEVGAVKFLDLSGIPAGMTVTEATLTMHVLASYSGNENPKNITVYPCLDDWNYSRFCWDFARYDSGAETEVYWNNSNQGFNRTPASDVSLADSGTYDIASHYGTTDLRDTQTCSTGSAVSFDVTETVKLWVSGTIPNNGFILLTTEDQIEIQLASVNNTTLQYRPSLSITYAAGPANIPPVAVGQSLTALESAALPITLSATDADGGTLTYSVVADPAHGILTGNPPNVTYTSDTGYTGNDTFTFIANDGEDDSNIATIQLTISGDADSDSIPDAWEETYFGSAANCQPFDDPDADLVTNLDEYLAGSDPLVNESLRPNSVASGGCIPGNHSNGIMVLLITLLAVIRILMTSHREN